MGYVQAIGDVQAGEPGVRRIGAADLGHALRQGWNDFRASPTQLIWLCVIYPVVGLVAAKAAFGYNVLPLLFPLASGFALVGPIAAIGVYELSRRREQGLQPSWLDAFSVLRTHRIGAIVTVTLLILAIFGLWMFAAAAIYSATIGGGPDAPPPQMGQFLHDVFHTRAGWTMIALGNFVGLLFACVVLALTVVSLPMLVDDKADATVALRTSIRAVQANPATMALWGLIVAALLAAGSALFFAGLAVAIPVLGHATWHLYRRVVAI